jgi:very-short-patch-repair endonuclease
LLGVSHRRRTRNATAPQARALRRRATETERFLWKLLRDRRLIGLKFRRQVPIGRYVLDFVCLRHHLVLEADGPFHDAEHDAERDAWLAAQGFRVLRFANKDIFSRASQVIEKILTTVEVPLADPSTSGTPHPSAFG